MRKILVTLVLAAGSLGAIAAPPVYDINDFSLAGVKLGMTADEAKAAMASHYKKSPANIYVKGGAHPTLLSSHPLHSTVEGMYTVVMLSESNPPRVYNVTTRLPAAMTAANWVGAINETAKRYGPPTIRRSEPGQRESAIWCDKRTDPLTIKRGFMCDKEGAFALRYSTSKLDTTAITLTSYEMNRQFQAQSKPVEAGPAFKY